MKMLKRILIANIIAMLAVGFNVVPAQAGYTELVTPVAITATGTITGVVETFSVDVVPQGGGASTPLVFEQISGKTADSGKALKITGKANVVNARIVIYTDNASYFTDPTKDPRRYSNGNPTGIDGAGMVGQDNAGYVAALLWGAKSAVNYDPNQNINYSFDGNTDDGVGEIYIVDKGHTHSFCPANDTKGLDTKVMYDKNGVQVPNPAGAGTQEDPKLYPQRWDEDLYDSSDPLTRKVVSEALYKNIATVAFGLGTGTNTAPYTDGGYYICQVANLSTDSFIDNVRAKLEGIDAGTADEYLYVYIAGDFTGKPAQTYETTKLNLAMVQDE